MGERKNLEISDRCFVKRSDKTASRIIGSEAVIISLGDSYIRGLNPVATRIWELLDEKITTEKIAEIISKEFKVELDEARKDTQQFLKQLVNRQLICLEE